MKFNNKGEMKTHHIKENGSVSSCGSITRHGKVTTNKTEVDCLACLKIINKVHKPIKCWVKVKGTDQSWDIGGKNKTVGEMISYFVSRLTDEVILKEVEKRGIGDVKKIEALEGKIKEALRIAKYPPQDKEIINILS